MDTITTPPHLILISIRTDPNGEKKNQILKT